MEYLRPVIFANLLRSRNKGHSTISVYTVKLSTVDTSVSNSGVIHVICVICDDASVYVFVQSSICGYRFSQLKGSSDDGKSLLRLDFNSDDNDTLDVWVCCFHSLRRHLRRSVADLSTISTTRHFFIETDYMLQKICKTNNINVFCASVNVCCKCD